jgi:hypothetical protein
MSDHEFEKRVHREMDELRLRPSEGVWAEVERSLRREKRRRRTLLWLPLMGLLLTAGGYLIFTDTNGNRENALAKSQATEKQGSQKAGEPSSLSTPSIAPTEPNSPSSQKTNNPTLDNSTQPAGGSKKVENGTTIIPPVAKNDNTSFSQKNNTTTVLNKTNGNKQPLNKTISPKQQRSNKDKDVSNDLDAVTVSGNRKGKQKSTDKTVNDKETAQPNLTSQQDALKNNQGNTDPVVDKTNETKVPAPKAAATIPPVDSTAKAIKGGDSTAKKPAPPPAIVKAPAKKKQAKGSTFQWGVIANASVANITEGSIFGGDLMKSVRVEDLTDQAPAYNGIPPMPTPEPSAIRPGPAFTLGGFVQTNTAKRFSISAGLQYTLVTVNTRVGRRVDSLLAVNYGTTNSQVTGSYYRADNIMHDYTNRYHFIELPLMASVRITGRRLPIVLDAGVSFSRLINTNALHYDGLTRVYYENDDFFDKSQFSLNTGLNVGLWQKSKNPVWVGPNLRYFTTTLLKRDVSASGDQQHIWSFGLNAKMLLKK